MRRREKKMWRNRISVQKLNNGKFAVRMVRVRKDKTGLISDRQVLAKSLSWVNAVEGQDVAPFIICTEAKTW